jgi:hypothetical protein
MGMPLSSFLDAKHEATPFSYKLGFHFWLVHEMPMLVVDHEFLNSVRRSSLEPRHHVKDGGIGCLHPNQKNEHLPT